MKKTAIIIMMILCIGSICSGVRADAETLTVVFEEWPPYQYTSEGKVTGTDVAILEEAARRLSINCQFKSMLWAKALEEVQDGTADAIFSLGIKGERAEFLYYPDTPINVMRIVFFSLKENPVKVSSLQDLKGLNVGIVKANYYGKDFDAAHGFKRTICSEHKEQFKMLLAKRFDLLISPDLVGTSVAKELGISDQVRMLEYVVAEEPLYIGFSKKKGTQAQLLATKFSQIFKQMQKEGFMKAVLQRNPE